MSLPRGGDHTSTGIGQGLDPVIDTEPTFTSREAVALPQAICVFRSFPTVHLTVARWVAVFDDVCVSVQTQEHPIVLNTRVALGVQKLRTRKF